MAWWQSHSLKKEVCTFCCKISEEKVSYFYVEVSNLFLELESMLL